METKSTKGKSLASTNSNKGIQIATVEASKGTIETGPGRTAKRQQVTK